MPMTVSEHNITKWQDFVFDLVDAKSRGLLEQSYQERIESAFRALGWSKAKKEICPKERINVGANNQLEPDITFKISGKPVYVVEVKQPANKLNHRQEEQLLSYMRMRQVVFGLYIGDEIILFYDSGEDLPTAVMQIDINTEASNGYLFIDLFARTLFSSERVKSYCIERYSEIHSNNILNSFETLLKENANDAINSILQDYFISTQKCDKDTVIKFLDEYRFNITKTGVENKKTDTPQETNPQEGTRYVLKQKGRRNNTGRDTTKYSIDGGQNYFGKGKFVREIVAAYIKNHPNISFEQIEQVFPDELQGSYGVVRKVDDIYNSDHDLADLLTRYVMGEDKILETKDGIKFVVCNQWGSFNFPHILELLDRWGWNVINDKNGDGMI